MAPHGHASHSEAATADCFLSRLQRLQLHLQKSNHRIASVLQNIPRTSAALRCWWSKMAGQFLSITQTAVLQTDDGRSLAEQKVFGELRR
jgi:hypothetical protein